MDEQVESLLNFLKRFRDDNKLTDDEFVKQLAGGIVDGEHSDPCLFDTLQDFRDLMRQTEKAVVNRLLERQIRTLVIT